MRPRAQLVHPPGSGTVTTVYGLAVRNAATMVGNLVVTDVPGPNYRADATPVPEAVCFHCGRDRTHTTRETCPGCGSSRLV